MGCSEISSSTLLACLLMAPIKTHSTACPGSYRVTHGISHATWQNPYLMAKTMQYELCHAMTFLMGYSKTHASHTLQWYEFCHAITSSSCSNDAPLLITQFNQSPKKCIIIDPLQMYPLSTLACSFHVPDATFSGPRGLIYGSGCLKLTN